MFISKNENSTERLFWIDNLKAIAIFGVILIHVTSSILPEYNSISSFYWWTGHLYNSFVRFSVPVFLMISGALLFSKNYDLDVFLKKRFVRIIYPFVFYSIIYILYNFSSKFYHGDKISLYEAINFIIEQILHGSSFHMWYIYMLIGIYLFIPIIEKWVKNCTEKEIRYFLFIWVLTLIFNQSFILKYKPDIDLTYFSGYLGYVILGYYLSTKSFKNIRFISIISILMILVGYIFTLGGTYLLSNLHGIFNGTLYSYLNINVLILSIGIFLYCKYQCSNNKQYGIASYISKYSFGIYLIHILVLTALNKIGINWELINPIIGIPLTTILCLFISSGVVYCINKLPYGEYISG